MLLAAIRKHRLESRVIVQSFDFRTLQAMKKLAPEIRLSALYQGPAKDFVEIAREAGAQIVSPVYTLVDKEQVAAHKAGSLKPEHDRAYFQTPRPVLELFDLDTDPGELQNLAGKPEYKDVQLTLMAALQEKLITDFDFVPPVLNETRRPVAQKK